MKPQWASHPAPVWARLAESVALSLTGCHAFQVQEDWIR
jgi:hypothetical protein